VAVIPHRMYNLYHLPSVLFLVGKCPAFISTLALSFHASFRVISIEFQFVIAALHPS
jgi:hypothetical protein